MPVRGEQLERRVRRMDAELSRLERAATRAITGEIADASRRLEREIRGLYLDALADTRGEDVAVREARARSLLARVEGLTDLTADVPDGELDVLVTGAAEAGASAAEDEVALYEDEARSARPRNTALAAIATTAAAAIARNGRQHQERIERHVVDGLAAGRGWGQVRTDLRQEAGILQRSAERHVKSTSVDASDEGHKATFEANGVQYEQLLATMDERLCGYCANRAGRVYELGDIQLPLHDHDRCTTVPWKREWQEAGLTDDEWFEAHRAESLARAQEGQRTGASPSERRRGLDKAPEPVWTPRTDTVAAREAVERIPPTPAPPPVVRPARPRVTEKTRSRGPTRPPTEAERVAARREFQGEWVAGARRKRSVALKHGAQQELGIRGLVYQTRRFNFTQAEMGRARIAARKMYEDTQAAFRRQGVAEVRLYRGVKTAYEDVGVIESWTTDINVARKFAGARGDIIEEVIPVERILISHRSPGWRDGRFGAQSEYVVMPHRPRRQ